MLLPELLRLIFTQLDPHSIYAVAVTCKQFHKIVSQYLTDSVIQYFVLKRCRFCTLTVSKNAKKHLKRLIQIQDDYSRVHNFLLENNARNIRERYIHGIPTTDWNYHQHITDAMLKQDFVVARSTQDVTNAIMSEIKSRKDVLHTPRSVLILTSYQSNISKLTQLLKDSNMVEPMVVSIMSPKTALDLTAYQNTKLLFIHRLEEIIQQDNDGTLLSIVQSLSSQTNKPQIVITIDSTNIEYLCFAEKLVDPDAHYLTYYDLSEYTLEGIRLYYVDVEKEEWKRETLMDLYECINICQAVIFCSNSDRVAVVMENLTKNGFTACSYEQIQDFRTGSSRNMVVDDSNPAVGMDVSQISLVISYDCPPSGESLVKVDQVVLVLTGQQRCGRKGKYGRKGVHIIFTTTQDRMVLHELCYEMTTEIEELPANVADII